MLKNPKVRAGIFIALAALFVWIYVESNREPDHVAEALKEVPADCTVTGVWRDADYPGATTVDLKNTVILCEEPDSRLVITVFDSDEFTTHTGELDEQNAVNESDFYSINDDGSLTIADEQGPFKTLPAADY